MATRMPFSAIVGQDQMKLALTLVAVDPRIGGVLIRGERGTAKSTAARALADLLPEIEVLHGSPYNDDPAAPGTWSLWARELAQTSSGSGQPLPTTRRRTPFVELPVGSTEDRVVGSFKLAAALREGRREFEPGVLAAANRGILYIDEVNLLDDHIVDLLLDAAAMGENRVEREGISYFHPARFILVGTMNPEEGELRPQLLDRFAFAVTIASTPSREERLEIMRRNLELERDPDGFRRSFAADDETLRSRILRARAFLEQVQVEDQDYDQIANLTMALRMDGHRGELTLLRAARASAALAGRRHIDDADLIETAALALPHRLKTPGDAGAMLEPAHVRRVAEAILIDGYTTDDVLSGAVEWDTEVAAVAEPGDSDASERTTAPTTARTGSGRSVSGRKTGAARAPKRGSTPATATQKKSDTAAAPTKTPRSRGRGRTVVETPSSRGRPRGARRTEDATGRDIDLGATLGAAARRGGAQGGAIDIQPEDVHRKVRVRPRSSLILFVLDGSESVASDNRVELAKGAILELLQDAYKKRDRVGLIVFGNNRAEIVLRPTHSTDRAQQMLRELTVGGNTPLNAGLSVAQGTFEQERKARPDSRLVMVLLTDGEGNVSVGDEPPMVEAPRLAGALNALGVRTLLINVEEPNLDFGSAATLADQLGATLVRLRQLTQSSLLDAVRRLQQDPLV